MKKYIVEIEPAKGRAECNRIRMEFDRQAAYTMLYAMLHHKSSYVNDFLDLDNGEYQTTANGLRFIFTIRTE